MKNVFLSLVRLFLGQLNFSRQTPFWLLFCCLAAACSKNESIPSGVLPPQKMVSILTDVHELEAKILLLKLDYDSSVALFKQQQALLFEKHSVNDSVYNKSFDYYLNRVELMNKIYEGVVDSLSLRRNIESGMGEEDKSLEPL